MLSHNQEHRIATAFGPISSVTELSGGYANYVHRLKFQSGASYILKTYPPHVRADSSIEVDQSRCIVERQAMLLFQDVPGSFKVPKVVMYSETNEFWLLMEDAGQQTVPFRDMLTKDYPLSQEELARIAEGIVSFMNYMSSVITDNPIFKNTAALKVYALLKNNRKQILERFPQTVDLIEKAEAEPKTCLAFGDWWPNSLLIDTNSMQIWIVDWEMVRYEHKKIDDVQFLTNLWIMLQQPTMFSTEAITFLMSYMHQKRSEFFGECHHSDWRISSYHKGRFLGYVYDFLGFIYVNWGVSGIDEAIEKAVSEVTSLDAV